MASINTELEADLASVYEEIMWLARRPNVTASVARSWYTHATSERLKKHVRMFTGKVSIQAIENSDAELRLEHYLRIQATLTQMVERHLESDLNDPRDFINTVLECERVHIVTKPENYAAMRAKGDYSAAGIKLVDWANIPLEQREYLWNKMLKGKVANYTEFRNPGNS
ncbi:MAG: hypothetical protein HKN50_10880 [Gammaproteobacteria bacterium]|nr:hypothetical protein [Gammaproteobacteria bacterium]